VPVSENMDGGIVDNIAQDSPLAAVEQGDEILE